MGTTLSRRAMHETNDLRVLEIVPLPPPAAVLERVPAGERERDVVWSARRELSSALTGADVRKVVIVGPCSIHDPVAALDYAHRLRVLRERLGDELIVVMRVYFEKPRTTLGWKGLINDPHLDGSSEIGTGIVLARELLLEVARLGMPAATEFLDPLVPQYIGDLVAWAAIGARTTESPTHREMASGLSMCVGFKNGTDGSVDAAMNAMIAASSPHSFLGIDASGRVSVVRTRGNSQSHVVLRGGRNGPNYSRRDVQGAAGALQKAGLNQRVLIDCNHDNSGKNFARQGAVIEDIVSQIDEGQHNILGAMLESNLVSGRQDLSGPRAKLVYGQSLTDGCLDFPSTERLLEGFARRLRGRRTATESRVRELTQG
jgi:3-deoxy-7-phosphoheptulonate synthase